MCTLDPSPTDLGEVEKEKKGIGHLADLALWSPQATGAEVEGMMGQWVGSTLGVGKSYLFSRGFASFEVSTSAPMPTSATSYESEEE